MKTIRGLIFGLIIGVGLGLWFGINIGNDRPIYANPFTEETVQEKIEDAGDAIMEKTGEALEKGGQALQDKIKETK